MSQNESIFYRKKWSLDIDDENRTLRNRAHMMWHWTAYDEIENSCCCILRGRVEKSFLEKHFFIEESGFGKQIQDVR